MNTPRFFTDSTGRQWHVEITVNTIRRVRKALGVDLLAVFDDGCKLLDRLQDDAVLVCDVLYVICRPDISDEEFGQRLASSSLANAQETFFEALADFFPQPEKAKTLRLLREKMKEVEAAFQKMKNEVIQASEPQIVLRDSFGNVPESSELPPANTA